MRAVVVDGAAELTHRLVTACENPYVNIIGNPTMPEMYIRAHNSTDKPTAYVSTLLPTSLLEAGVPAYTDPRRAAHALAVNASYSLRPKRTRATMVSRASGGIARAMPSSEGGTAM